MLTTSGSTVGTSAYMSPEQARGEKVDVRTDIWSLGVVIYEMITGRLPFKSEYNEAIVYLILNENPPPLTSLPSDVTMDADYARSTREGLIPQQENQRHHTRM